jgi:hypothetical protein
MKTMFFILLSILGFNSQAQADQVMDRHLLCRVVSYSNVPNSIIVSAQAYYDLAPIRFVKKGTAVIPVAEHEFRYTDANGKLLATFDIHGGLHLDQKNANLSLSIHDARDYVMASSSGELRLKQSSMSTFAKLPARIPAVLFGKDTSEFQSVYTINVEMTGLTILCSLEKSK